jgi:hypothetical protein
MFLNRHVRSSLAMTSFPWVKLPMTSPLVLASVSFEFCQSRWESKKFFRSSTWRSSSSYSCVGSAMVASFLALRNQSFKPKSLRRRLPTIRTSAEIVLTSNAVCPFVEEWRARATSRGLSRIRIESVRRKRLALTCRHKTCTESGSSWIWSSDQRCCRVERLRSLCRINYWIPDFRESLKIADWSSRLGEDNITIGCFSHLMYP